MIINGFHVGFSVSIADLCRFMAFQTQTGRKKKMTEKCKDCGHEFSFGARCPKCKSTNHETLYDLTDEFKKKMTNTDKESP